MKYPLIFINYRHSDSGAIAKKLDEILTKQFGRQSVFRDRTGIEGGEKWSDKIEKKVEECSIMLSLIGSTWQTAQYDDSARAGRLRLDDEDDWVRKEIIIGLNNSHTTVIPVLIDSTQMPPEEWLKPCKLDVLAGRQAEEISQRVESEDIAVNSAQLIRAIRTSYKKKEVLEAISCANEQEKRPSEQFQAAKNKSFQHFLEQLLLEDCDQELDKLFNAQSEGIPSFKHLIQEFKEKIERETEVQLEREAIRSWINCFNVKYIQLLKGETFEKAKDEYQNSLCSDFSKVQLARLGIDNNIIEKELELTLQDLFVMPQLRQLHKPASRDQHSQRVPEEADKKTGVPDEKETVGLELNLAAKWLLKRDISHSLVLGVPGAGKTDLVSYMVLSLCGQWQEDFLDKFLISRADNIDSIQRLPIALKIRDYSQKLDRNPDLKVLDFIKNSVKNQDARPKNFFEYWLDSGRAFVLIDGLDETYPQKVHQKTVAAITAFIKEYKHNRFVITARPIGSLNEWITPDFYRYQLQPFEQEQVNEFITRWYSAQGLSGPQHTESKKALKKLIANSKRLQSLAKVPLLLTMILLVHQKTGRLPREQHQLYGEVITLLLSKWDEELKDIHRDSQLKDLDISDLQILMQELAYWMQREYDQTENGKLSVCKHDLVRQLSASIRNLKKNKLAQAEVQAKLFLEEIVCDRAGLLHKRTDDDYAFVHRTFQEYLAAKYLYSESVESDSRSSILKITRQKIHRPKWQQTLLFTISQLANGSAAAIEVVDTVVKNKSPYEKWLHRDLIFAGSCLAENSHCFSQKNANSLTTQILTALVRIDMADISTTGSRVRNQTQLILLSLSETHLEKQAIEIIETQAGEESAGRALMYKLALSKDEKAIDRVVSRLKDDRGSEQVISLIEEISRYSRISTLLVKELSNEFRGELGIAEALDRLGYTGEHKEYVDHIRHEAAERNWRPESRTHPKYEAEANQLYAEIGSHLETLSKERSPEALSALLDYLTFDDYGIPEDVAKKIGKLHQLSGEIEKELITKMQTHIKQKNVSHKHWLYELSKIIAAIGYLHTPSARAYDVLMIIGEEGSDWFVVKREIATALGRMASKSNYDQTKIIEHLFLLLDSIQYPITSFEGDFIDGEDMESKRCLKSIGEALTKMSQSNKAVPQHIERWIEANQKQKGIGFIVDILSEAVERSDALL